MTASLNALKREARKQGTSPERRLELAALGPELAREVARAQHTPPEVLARLADTDDLPTLERLAANKRTPPEVLLRLASCVHWEVVWWVAQNPGTPLAALEALTGHPSAQVRQWLAANPAMPLPLLIRLREESLALTYEALKTLVEYGEGAAVDEARLLRAVTLTELIPAPTALRLLASVQWHPLLREQAGRIALSVRPDILALLQGGTP